LKLLNERISQMYWKFTDTVVFLSNLFSLMPENNSESLMQVIDKINHQFPKAIKLRAEGLADTWKVPVEYLLQRYTTDWSQLAVVSCS